MAGFSLSYSLQRSGISFEPRFLTPAEEDLDDRHLGCLIRDWKPDVIVATLYLWNVERSLDVLKKARENLPGLKIIVGGPEVARPHPFLFKSRVPDVAVVGEGEPVFPGIIKALGRGEFTNFSRVAWKGGDAYGWGKNVAPVLTLDECLPPPRHPGWKPDAHGMAYLEASRGCPLRCIYCRYGHLRRRISFICTAELQDRIQVMMHRGAREIRFVDPVFNAHPEFPEILRALRRVNRFRKISFFAEIQADLLHPDEINLLAEAGFTEVEAGVQSLEPFVLREIHRPVRMEILEKNLRLLTRQGIRVTIDLMYGLPGQKRRDVEGALCWARKFRPAYVQCFQTLLIPGTELRAKRRFWQIAAGPQPPYGVSSTKTLSEKDVRHIEGLIQRKSPADGMTRKFVGTRLPDLFQERIFIPADKLGNYQEIEGKTSQRALVISGTPLYARSREITAVIRKAIRSEPHMLWQFVINSPDEEPLDLLEEMIREIRRHPSHWIDRFAYVAGWHRIASRRVFVLLKRQALSYSPSWLRAAETLLEDHFY